MKTNLIRTLLSAAAVLSLSAAAFAQSYLGANVPFSFRMNGRVMPAGNYQIGPTGSTGAVDLRSSKQAAFAIGTPAITDDARARLVFRCGETSGCSLTEIWTDAGRGWTLPGPKLTAAEKERLAVVYLGRKGAD